MNFLFVILILFSLRERGKRRREERAKLPVNLYEFPFFFDSIDIPSLVRCRKLKDADVAN
jgi:hypothetical protein